MRTWKIKFNANITINFNTFSIYTIRSKQKKYQIEYQKLIGYNYGYHIPFLRLPVGKCMSAFSGTAFVVGDTITWL